MGLKPIMGIKELSNYLDIREQTLYKLIQQGRIPALKIGGQWKIKSEHIEKMFEEILEQKIRELKQ